MEERLYDLIFIVRPATPEDEIKKVLTTVEHACTEKGGKIEKTEHWGTRKLAYRVSKHREGIYVAGSHGRNKHRVTRDSPPQAGLTRPVTAQSGSSLRAGGHDLRTPPLDLSYTHLTGVD